MNLRDAKAQVEREQPHLTGTAKIEAIKALRMQATRTESRSLDFEPRAVDQASKPATEQGSRVATAWGFLAFIFIGMRLISYFTWGSITGAPHWYDALYAVFVIGSVAELVSAYRNRGDRNS